MRKLRLSAVSIAATWRIVQAAAVSVVAAAIMRATIPYDTGMYCKACLEYLPAWVCALQGCF